jgi:hypothetical protein
MAVRPTSFFRLIPYGGVAVWVRPTDVGLVVSHELDMTAADEFRQYAASAVDPTRKVAPGHRGAGVRRFLGDQSNPATD